VINNLGGIGTSVTAIMLIASDLSCFFRFGTTMTAADFRITGDLRLIGSFGIICFGLVGLELASIMGDEIQDPGRTLPGALAGRSAVRYFVYRRNADFAPGREQTGYRGLQGVVQAVSHMAEQVQVPGSSPPSPWYSAFPLPESPRLGFLARRDSFRCRSRSVLAGGLGKLHKRFATPYVALIVHASFSAIFLAMSLSAPE